jgi:hypothetical protein
MAMCRQCNGEMMEEISCLSDPIAMCGGLFEPIRWGDERESARWVVDFACRDCRTPVGGVHHPGCCVERCPACLGQALGCPCFRDPDDDDGDDDDGDENDMGDDDGDLAAHVRTITRCRAHTFHRYFKR